MNTNSVFRSDVWASVDWEFSVIWTSLLMQKCDYSSLICLEREQFEVRTRSWDQDERISDYSTTLCNTWLKAGRTGFMLRTFQKALFLATTTCRVFCKAMALGNTFPILLWGVYGELPGAPVVKIQCFQCTGCRLDPWAGNKDPTGSAM